MEEEEECEGVDGGMLSSASAAAAAAEACSAVSVPVPVPVSAPVAVRDAAGSANDTLVEKYPLSAGDDGVVGDEDICGQRNHNQSDGV